MITEIIKMLFSDILGQFTLKKLYGLPCVVKVFTYLPNRKVNLINMFEKIHK